MNLRPFTKVDWYGYGGASRFPNGDEPLIGHCGNYEFVIGGECGDVYDLTDDSSPVLLRIDTENLYRSAAEAKDALQLLVNILTHKEEITDGEQVCNEKV
jgi:hypothetical protein